MSSGAGPDAGAATAAHRTGTGVRSNEAASIADQLLRAEPLQRRSWLHTLEESERAYVFSEVAREVGSVYGLWYDDPVGFGEDVLGESFWSTQRQVLAAIPHTKRLIVPAGFGLGKTHLAARAAAWFVCTAPVGRALCVTTAPRFRQVRTMMWPHIRRVHARAGLPGECLQTEWQIPDANGVMTQVAYGFSAPATSESAMQGIHAARLLLLVDEAGGIAKTVGRGTNNLLTGDARMLAIGNPPSDDPRSWFEEIAEEGELGEVPDTRTIPMAVPDNPRITGDESPVCKDCTPNFDKHRVASHLPDQEWVDRAIAEYGEDHPYVISKVWAKFPKGGGNKAIPVTWVDAALEMADPEGDDYVRLCDLGLEGETDEFAVAKGAWVRLGVDVAAAGGDEFVICRSVGDVLHERHASSGSENASAVDVAEKVLAHIHAAQALAKALKSDHQKIRVKVDTIGVGWGVVGMLERWGPDGTGRHDAVIVPVNVAESPERIDEGGVMRPYRKRDELWLAGRALMQPDPSTGEGRLRLRVTRSAAAQFSTPDLSTNTAGYTVVEGKPSMRKRGLKSPDRAEAALLAIYEPVPLLSRRRRGVLN